MKIGKLVVAMVSLPSYVLGALFVGLSLLLGIAEDPRIKGCIFAVTWRKKWASVWRYTTTIGRGVGFHPGHVAVGPVHGHEMVHTRQSEDGCAHGLFVAVLIVVFTKDYVLAIAVWFSLAQVAFLLNMAMSGLRYGWSNAYRQSEHERAAYSQYP